MIPTLAASNETYALASPEGNSEGKISLEGLQRSLEATPWSRDAIETLLADEERTRLAIDGGEKNSRWVHSL